MPPSPLVRYGFGFHALHLLDVYTKRSYREEFQALCKAADKLLPDGHWAATWEEIEARFGGEAGSKRRLLVERLTEWKDALRGYQISGTLILDGSFVSAKERPGDIDAFFVSGVNSMEVIATEPKATHLLSHVRMNDSGFGDVFYFTETAVRDFPAICRLDGFDVDSRTGTSNGVLRVRI